MTVDSRRPTTEDRRPAPSFAAPEHAPRNVWAFGFTSLFNDTASEMAYWILPAFLVSLGAGPAKLGLIEGIAESVASLAKLLSGYITDRLHRRKPLVVAGYALANAAKPFLAVATAWWHVLLVRFADRVSKGVRGTPRDVMLAESLPKEQFGSGFGFQQAMDTAGAVLGPAVAIVLVPSIGLRGVFWAAAIPGALCVLVVLFAVEERPRASATPIQNSKVRIKNSEAAHLAASFYYVLAAVALFSLGNSSDMFLVLRAQSIGIPAVHAPLLGLVFNSAYTLAAWPAGKLSDRVAKPIVAAAGYMVFSITYLVFARAPSRSGLWGAMAFYGLYYALTDPVLRALVAQTVAPELRGRAFGTYYFVVSVAMLLSSIITGELWKHFGPAAPFYVSAALASMAAAMLLLLPKRRGSSVPA